MTADSTRFNMKFALENCDSLRSSRLHSHLHDGQLDGAQHLRWYMQQ